MTVVRLKISNGRMEFFAKRRSYAPKTPRPKTPMMSGARVPADAQGNWTPPKVIPAMRRVAAATKIKDPTQSILPSFDLIEP